MPVHTAMSDMSQVHVRWMNANKYAGPELLIQPAALPPFAATVIMYAVAPASQSMVEPLVGPVEQAGLGLVLL